MRGQAFVTFPDVRKAEEALHQVHGYVLKEKIMIVVTCFFYSPKGICQTKQMTVKQIENIKLNFIFETSESASLFSSKLLRRAENCQKIGLEISLEVLPVCCSPFCGTKQRKQVHGYC